jgi:urea carboxylase-associated protein 2
MTEHDDIAWHVDIPAGAHWSGVLRRGLTLRLIDLEGGVNAATLLYRQDQLLERYNMADTLKAQHTAYLTRGHVCYSDMGRILCSITADSCGWHDPLCGVSTPESVEAKFGRSRFQEQRNDFHRNGRDSLLTEIAKHGLGLRDLCAPINFFSKVTVDAAGGLHFVAGHSKAGDRVELRFEMPTLVAISTSPHPLDPARSWAPRPLRLEAIATGTAPPQDACRDSCPENARGFLNTEMLYA